MASSSSFSYRPKYPASNSSLRVAKGVTDFLQSSDKLSNLLPAVHRLASLQRACESAFPALFEHCTVMHFDAGQLLVAAPNAAVLSKLRQRLPYLQEVLQKQGWQVNAIRLKVQVGKIEEKSTPVKTIRLSAPALSAFKALEGNLESSSGNAELVAAVKTLLARHKNSQ